MLFEPGLSPSFVDIVLAVRERLGAQPLEYNGIYVTVDKTGVIMKGRSMLSSVFLRHFKNSFFDDI